MDPVNFSSTTKIFVATNLLETAKELQLHLSTISYDEQPAYAEEAIEIMGDPREIYGSKKILLHSLGAMVLCSNSPVSSIDEQLLHGTYFGDAIVRANFNRLAYVRHSALRSLCLNLAEVSILRSKTNPDFEGENIRTGVYIPVHSVNLLLAA